MEDPRSFFEEHVPRSLDRIQKRLPDGVVVAFHITGSGGGAWQVDPDDRSIGPIDGRPKDCEVFCSAQDFMDILQGSLSPQLAFEEGRLQVVGDVGLLLKLRRMFVRAA